MKYLVGVMDRHVDPWYEIFESYQEAFKFSRMIARRIVAHPEYMKRRRIKGYSVFWQYELEEDHVFVKRMP